MFEIAEEFALCYGVTDSMFKALRPYITIGEQFRPQPRSYAVDSTIYRQRDSIREVNQRRWEQKRAAREPHPYERFRIDTVGAAYLRSIGFTYLFYIEKILLLVIFELPKLQLWLKLLLIHQLKGKQYMLDV